MYDDLRDRKHGQFDAENGNPDEGQGDANEQNQKSTRT